MWCTLDKLGLALQNFEKAAAFVPA